LLEFHRVFQERTSNNARHSFHGRSRVSTFVNISNGRLLSDSIIVMQKGEIVASGTPLQLKSKYGAGYRLSLTSTSVPESTRPPVDSAKLESSAAGEIIWRIEKAEDLGKVVRWADKMEHETRRRGGNCNEEMKIDGGKIDNVRVQGWEISMPTLEEVLLEKKLF
jgi:ABC-type multidrug transport system ATPase subunit